MLASQSSFTHHPRNIRALYRNPATPAKGQKKSRAQGPALILLLLQRFD
jgi:hypothetical protein